MDLDPGDYLHFCQANRAWALGQHRAFLKGVLEKILPVFKDINSEAEAFAEAEFQRLLSVPCSDAVDIGDIAERTMDDGVEKYRDLEFVQGQLHVLCVAGIYHLWERTLKDFMLREIDFGGDEKIREIRMAGFEKLICCLTKLGFDVKSEQFFAGMETANLVTNACKHGGGPSLDRLAMKAPNLLQGPDQSMPLLPFAPPHPDNLWVDASKIEEFGSSIEQFWREMPEHLPRNR